MNDSSTDHDAIFIDIEPVCLYLHSKLFLELTVLLFLNVPTHFRSQFFHFSSAYMLLLTVFAIYGLSGFSLVAIRKMRTVRQRTIRNVREPSTPHG